MKRFYLFLLCFFTLYSIHAQEEPIAYAVDNEFNLWGFNQSYTAYVFAEKAYIRDYPSLQSNLIDSLPHATPVIVTSEPYTGTVIRGFYAPWHEVKYLKNGQMHKGYIWLGLLALNATSNKQGHMFIHGFKRHHPSTEYNSAYYLAQLKVFNKANELIEVQDYHAEIDDQTFCDTKLLPSMGLENIENIHRIAFLGEGCGIPSYYYYFAWNGTSLIRFPDRMNVSDAGVFFIDESILFPSEHQEDRSTILKNKVEGENLDQDSDTPSYRETESQQIFIWDGYQLSELITMH